jgi:predicted DNA-binding transcriptional regulator YafY
MELFSEIYGCYFTVVAGILEDAQKGLTKKEIEERVQNHGFYESSFYLLPSLFSGEWNLLEEQDKKYYSKVLGRVNRPISNLEKSWLKAVLSDPRIHLFLNREAYEQFEAELQNVLPLYEQDDFHLYDQHLDGDSYHDPRYIRRFQEIIHGLQEQKPLSIEYMGPKSGLHQRTYYPYRLCYSTRDDKFRLQCGVYNKVRQKLERVFLNLERMVLVKAEEKSHDVQEEMTSLFREMVCKHPVVLEITTGRNALERCMLQFSSFEKQTEYDIERNLYICRIWVDPMDETELLIRILSFGPVVKVVGPDSFLKQVKERLERQIGMGSGGSRNPSWLPK